MTFPPFGAQASEMPMGGKEKGESPGRKEDGETEGTLATATLRGEVAELRKLIASGVDIEEKDEVNAGPQRPPWRQPRGKSQANLPQMLPPGDNL